MRIVMIAFLVFFVVPMVCCLTCMSMAPKKKDQPTAVEATTPTPAVPAVDLTRLLPSRAGDLALLSSNIDRWPNPEDRHATGNYDWGGTPGRVQLADYLRSPIATLKCAAKPDPQDHCEKGSHPVKLGSKDACFYREERPGVGAMGAAVMWDDCLLQFKIGGLEGHSQKDVIAAATAAAAFVSSRR